MSKTHNDEDIIEVSFPKINHFWIDSGLLGLYRIAEQCNSKDLNVEMSISDNGVVFKGTESDVDKFLHDIYEILLSQYYNTSSRKQVDNNDQFYYDSKNDKFVRFPKIKTMGIAELIFNHATTPTKTAIKYEEDGTLPKDYEHLQESLKSFLFDTGIKHGNKLLIDGPYETRPKIYIDVKKGKPKGTCFLCGNLSHSLSDIGSSVFPMITGKSGVLSFNSMGNSPEKVCWKCSYISKFVPVVGFYVMNRGALHMYLPYSSSLEKMNYVQKNLQIIRKDDPNLFSNFDQQLGGFFQRPFEQFFSFLYSLYRIVMVKKTVLDGDSGYELDYEKLFDITLSKAPVGYYVVDTERFSNAQMGKMIWFFQGSVYFFRLMDRMEKNNIDIKNVMTLLIDSKEKNVKKKLLNNKAIYDRKTLLRNRICERILNMQSIVDMVEKHVFSINKSDIKNIRPLHDFVITYEKILNEEGEVMKQNVINVAISLGKSIGNSIGGENERFKPREGKDYLFRLRRARKIEDFLNEINRIQINYDVSVSRDLYEIGQAIEENFTEFKQFCMIVALNMFNYRVEKQWTKKQKKDNNGDNNVENMEKNI